MDKLYENIKTYREARGMSQEELAKRTGYTDRSSITKIEKGLVDLQQSKILLFAEALDVPVLDLLGWRETEESQLSDTTSQMLKGLLTDVEEELVEKYRILDEEYQKMVKELLEALAGKNKESSLKKAIS